MESPRSRLMALPPELRTNIWEYVLINHAWLENRSPSNRRLIIASENWRKKFGNEKYRMALGIQPAITGVSHQIRDEVLPLFYSTYIFDLPLDTHSDLITADRWLTCIGRSSRYVGGMSFWQTEAGEDRFTMVETHGSKISPWPYTIDRGLPFQQFEEMDGSSTTAGCTDADGLQGRTTIVSTTKRHETPIATLAVDYLHSGADANRSRELNHFRDLRSRLDIMLRDVTPEDLGRREWMTVLVNLQMYFQKVYSRTEVEEAELEADDDQ